MKSISCGRVGGGQLWALGAHKLGATRLHGKEAEEKGPLTVGCLGNPEILLWGPRCLLIQCYEEGPWPILRMSAAGIMPSGKFSKVTLLTNPRKCHWACMCRRITCQKGPSCLPCFRDSNSARPGGRQKSLPCAFVSPWHL